LLWASTTRIQLLDYFYYTALTATALYENATAEEPDVLMLDLRMPKKDGLQIVAELMSQRVSKARTVVMTSFS
jgi:YesN/AraC family two-component response regulator